MTAHRPRESTPSHARSGNERGAFVYDAFISYSHQDQAVAAAIHKGLHRIGRRMGRLSALRVFRDSTDLDATPDLWGRIIEAMESSRYFILVLSPRAIASIWVNRELDAWLERRGSDRLLLVVAEGQLVWDELNSCFDPHRSDVAPRALTQPGALEHEPLYVDITGGEPWDLAAPQLREKITDLAAPIHGKPKYELASDDAREQRRFRRWRRAVIVGLVVLTFTSLIAAASAVLQRREADAQRTAARAAELAVTAANLPDEQLDRAIVLALAGDALDQSTATRAGLLAALAANPRIVREIHLDAGAKALVGTADGELVAAAVDNRIVVVDLIRGSTISEFSLAGGLPQSLAFSPDGRTVAVGATDGTVTLWDAESGSKTGRSLTRHHDSVRAVAFSPDGLLLASGGEDHLAMLHRLDGSQPDQTFAGHTDWINAIAFSADGDQIFTGSGATEGQSTDSRILAWPLDTDAEPTVLGTYEEAVRGLAVSSDGRWLASAGADMTLRLWDLSIGVEVASATGHTERVFSVAFSADGTRLVSASRDRTVRTWDVAESELRPGEVLRGHELEVRGAVVTAPETAVSAGEDGRLVVWDIAPQHPQRLTTRIDGTGPAVAASADGNRLATNGPDTSIVLRDAMSGLALAPAVDLGERVSALEFAPDGMLVVAVGGRLEIWDLVNGEQVAGPVETGGLVVSLAVAADGRIAAGDVDGHLAIWPPDLDVEARRLDGHSTYITGLAFTKAQEMVSADADGLLYLWRLAEGAEPKLLSEVTGQFTSLAAGPSGDLVVAGDTDGRIHAFARQDSAGDWTEQVVLADDGIVNGLDVAADGQSVVAGDKDGSVSLWAVDAGLLRSVGPKRPAGAGLHDASFAGIGMVTSGATGMMMWDLDPQAWRIALCEIAGRDLTVDERREYEPDLDDVRVCPAMGQPANSPG